MAASIITYLHDHLAGARLAVSLLHDLRQQNIVPDAASLAARLLSEIEADRTVLENFVNQIGSESNVFKEAAAWLTQKASLIKLNLHEPLGIFEAVEILSLGVLGKLALWTALEAAQPDCPLDLPHLKQRAHEQHQALELLRLQLTVVALR